MTATASWYLPISMTRIELSGIVRLVSAAYFSTALMSSLLMTTAFFGACASPATGQAAHRIVRICKMFFRIRTSYWTSTSSMATRSGPSIIAARIRRDRCSKMHDVPLDRTQRVLMIHMDVIEPLDLAGLSIFDQRIVWASKIPKTSLARRRDSLGAQFQNLFLRRQSGQRIAR